MLDAILSLVAATALTLQVRWLVHQWIEGRRSSRDEGVDARRLGE